METEIQYTFIWQQLANLPLWFPFFLLFWWVCHQNIYIILQSVILETCDWDTRGITKVFTRITDQGSRRVIFLQTFQQSGFFLATRKVAPCRPLKRMAAAFTALFQHWSYSPYKTICPLPHLKWLIKLLFLWRQNWMWTTNGTVPVLTANNRWGLVVTTGSVWT